jgi:leader peptidase (prepilin peptidase)/N-methyltransferase
VQQACGCNLAKGRLPARLPWLAGLGSSAKARGRLKPLVTMPSGPWFASSLFALGLLVGSFLNVVIARVPAGQSIVHPGSRCPRCGHALAWFENVPLLSWLVLRAKCRSCRAPISARYPAVELLTGCLFLACWLRFGLSWSLLRGLLVVGFLIPLTFIDLEHWLLPFELTLSGLALGLLSACLLGWEALRDSILGAGAGFLFFWGLENVVRWLLRKEGLGAGDKWLVALLGAFLGWQPLFGLVLLSNVQGAVVGSALLLFRGRAGPAPAVSVAEGVPRAGLGSTVPVSGAPSAAEFAPKEKVPVEDDDWRPGPTHLPFGPWLALAGLELMLLGPALDRVLPSPLARLLLGRLGS